MTNKLTLTLPIAVLLLSACEGPSPTASAPAVSNQPAASSAAPAEGLQFYLAEANVVARACDSFLSGGSAKSLTSAGYSFESRRVRTDSFGPVDGTSETFTKSVNGGFQGSFLGTQRVLEVRTLFGENPRKCAVVMRGVKHKEDKPAYEAFIAALPPGKYGSSLSRTTQGSTIVESLIRIRPR